MTQNNVIPFPTRKIESSSEAVNHSPVVLAPEQSNNSVFEIQNYLPKGRKVQLIEESKGTHQIPHKIFEFMIKSTESRVEASVFACLVRYTLGFHRSTCETSHTFIAKWTGYSVTSVRRGLDALISAELIRCLEAGRSQADSTVYEVCIIKGYLNSLTQHSLPTPIVLAPKAKETINQIPVDPIYSNAKPLCHHPAQHHAIIRHSSVPDGGTKKDNTNKDSNKTLSPSEQLPKFLETYFSNLTPEQKKQRELKFFQSIKRDFNIQDISDVAQFLVDRGIPSTGAQCHSPMAYLSLSMSTVLPCVIEQRDKQKRRAELAIQEQQKRQEEARREAEETGRFNNTLALFYQAFPTEELRGQYFRKFAVENPLFSPGSFMLKNIAISAWADSLKSNSDKI